MRACDRIPRRGGDAEQDPRSSAEPGKQQRLGEELDADLPAGRVECPPQAAARQVTIETTLGDARATGDRVLLERLVTNLIDNAVRYNVPGGWVRATTGRQADAVRLAVANSGQPVPADRVPELFEPFRRLGSRGDGGTGSGLGLSIAASVVTAHGGQIRAQARPDGGLEIEVTLPFTGERMR